MNCTNIEVLISCVGFNIVNGKLFIVFGQSWTSSCDLVMWQVICPRCQCQGPPCLFRGGRLPAASKAHLTTHWMALKSIWSCEINGGTEVFFFFGHLFLAEGVWVSDFAWPEGIRFLSNTIKGIANTFLKLLEQNFTWNDCVARFFSKQQ